MSGHRGWLWDSSRELGVSNPGRNGPPDSATNQSRWFKGEHFKRYLTRQQLPFADVDTLLQGWIPSQPIIHPQSRIVALGSCFAGHFVEWLDRHGYNNSNMEASRALLRNRFESAAVVEQLFRWAYAELDPTKLVWIGKDADRIFPTEDARRALLDALAEADLLIVTLSLSEVWYDKVTGEPLWRMSKDLYDPERHRFKVLSVAETLQAFESIERIRRLHLPKLKVVYTVSPMPLAATYRPVSSLTASCASKAIVRASLDEFLRAREDLNRTYFYYPGYEIVTELIPDPFLPDNRHLCDYVIEAVMDQFACCFMSGMDEDSLGRHSSKLREAMSGEPHRAELERRVAGLERRTAELQTVCDERMSMIQDLEKACGERLDVINGLQKVCDQRLALVDELHQVCADRLAVIEEIARSRETESNNP